MQGVQLLDKILLSGQGVVGLGGLGPCLRSTGGPLAHDTTSWDVLGPRALGKVLGPWEQGLAGAKKQAGLGPGGLLV